MSVYTFAVNSIIRGYHKYRTVWESPADREVLRCECEVGNSHDTYTVAIMLTLTLTPTCPLTASIADDGTHDWCTKGHEDLITEGFLQTNFQIILWEIA